MEKGADDAKKQKYTFQLTCEGFEESTVSGYVVEDFRLKVLETFEELINFEFDMAIMQDGKSYKIQD